MDEVQMWSGAGYFGGELQLTRDVAGIHIVPSWAKRRAAQRDYVDMGWDATHEVLFYLETDCSESSVIDGFCHCQLVQCWVSQLRSIEHSIDQSAIKASRIC